MSSYARGQAHGFTVVEIAVVVPIVSIIILGVFTIIVAMLQSSAVERVGAQNLYDIHSALGRVEQDASLTGSFLPDVDDGLTDNQGPSTGWSYAGSNENNRVLILRSYATTTNPDSNDRRPVFLTQQGCGVESIYYNQPLTYNTVYFVKNKTLYRRLLVDTSKVTCSPWVQKQTCQIGGGCLADDETIATDVTGFSVDYYPDSASTTKTEVYTDAMGDAEVLSSNAVQVTISLTRQAYGQPLTSSLPLRISKLVTGNTND